MAGSRTLPEGEVTIRNAEADDSRALADLIRELGFAAEPAEIAARLGHPDQASQMSLIAEKDGEIVGCATLDVMQVLHRPHAVGRISMLIVAQNIRRRGVGRALVEAAKERLEKAGCGLLEVTSNMDLKQAHAFYESLGFERTSFRFVKALDN